MPVSNRDYAPAQLLEQMMVSIWCVAKRFVDSDITRLEKLWRVYLDGHELQIKLAASPRQYWLSRKINPVQPDTPELGYGF